MPAPRQGSSTTRLVAEERVELDRARARARSAAGPRRRRGPAGPDRAAWPGAAAPPRRTRTRTGSGSSRKLTWRVAALDHDARAPGCSDATLASCEGTPVSTSGLRTSTVSSGRASTATAGRGREQRRRCRCGSTPTRAWRLAVAHDDVSGAPVALPAHGSGRSGCSAVRANVDVGDRNLPVGAGPPVAHLVRASGSDRRGRAVHGRVRVGPQAEPQRFEAEGVARRDVRRG